MRVNCAIIKKPDNIIYDYSSDVMSCDVCRMAGPDIAGKTEFVTGKKMFKRESVVYHNKSQKNEKCFNIWYQLTSRHLGIYAFQL
jgi:hypothetical protein